MRIAAREILVLILLSELGLVTGGASAQDAAGGGAVPPEQIARTVEGSPPAPATNFGNYAIQNDLLTGLSLPADAADAPSGSWMTPPHLPDLADPDSEQLADLDDEIDILRDPNEPRTIQLSDSIRGRLKAKSGGAMLGITIGFW